MVIQVTRLKVAPNMADPTSMKQSVSYFNVYSCRSIGHAFFGEKKNWLRHFHANKHK